MRRAILGGVVAVLLVIASTAIAGAQQPSQDGDPQIEQPRSHDEMRGWMADHWDEMPEMGDWDQMPMNGGSGHLEEGGWMRFHDDMHQWMTDNWDDKPMYGGDSDEWLDHHGEGGVEPCHGADLGPDRNVRTG